jgi:hypothetical protein
MTRCAELIALCVAISACTTIKIGPGDSSSITYEGGADVGKDLATRACHKAGQQGVEIISTVNKDPSLPPGTGKQIVTFRCSSVERQ